MGTNRFDLTHQFCIDDYVDYHQPISLIQRSLGRWGGACRMQRPAQRPQPLIGYLCSDMTAVPTAQELATLGDEEIASLAADWRARAGYGDREAFGMAHALEVEQRRRLRESQLHPLPQSLAEPAPARTWWKAWRIWQVRPSGAGDRPMSRT